MRKGQVWSYDILTAVVVFIITFAFLIFFWWSVTTLTTEPRPEGLALGARDISDALLSPGNPEDWNTVVDPGDAGTWGAISLLGMGEEFGSQEISIDKASKLVQMDATNYTALKAKLRINYNFYVEMKEFYNCSETSIIWSPMNCTARGILPGTSEWNSLEHFASTPSGNFTLGIGPDAGGARSVSVLNRFAIYNGSLVRLKVITWTNQTWQ